MTFSRVDLPLTVAYFAPSLLAGRLAAAPCVDGDGAVVAACAQLLIIAANLSFY